MCSGGGVVVEKDRGRNYGRKKQKGENNRNGRMAVRQEHVDDFNLKVPQWAQSPAEATNSVKGQQMSQTSPNNGTVRETNCKEYVREMETRATVRRHSWRWEGGR